MTHRLDDVLSRWCDRWAAHDVDGLVGLYRHDAALHWMPAMPRSDWGTVGITTVLHDRLDRVTTAWARYGRPIGPDHGVCGVPFQLRMDDDIYEGFAFMRLSPASAIEIDRRYAGPTFEPLWE